MLLYYPQFCMAAIAATLLLIVMYYLKRNYVTTQNRIFMLMVFDNLLASSVNILTFYTISFPERYPRWVIYFANQSYLLVFNLMAVLFLLYVDSMTKIPKLYTPVRMTAIAVVSLEAALLFTSPLTHLVIYFDEYHVYRHGPLMPLLYVFAFLCVAWGDFIFISMRKRFNLYQVISVTCFVGMIFLSVVFQVFFPKYVITNLSCALMLIFIYSAFENPAYYMYKDTRCCNRQAFLTTIKRFKKKSQKYAVISVKLVNYSYISHAIGQNLVEILLSKVAERLNDNYRKSVYNLEDDCFVIIQDEDCDGAQIKREVQELFEMPFALGNGREAAKVSLSVIVSVIKPNTADLEPREMEEIVRAVCSKEEEEIAPESIAAIVKNLHREEKIAGVIDRSIANDFQGFDVFFQPILDVGTGKYPSSEALIRLKDEELGFISPDEFIPISEKNGRIIEIGDYVFARVCELLHKTRDLNLGLEYVEINLSPIQCYQEELAKKFLAMLSKYGLSPSNVNLEITETAEMETRRLKILHQNLHRLGEHGVTFSIDDFGSGFAAINYLLSLPVSIVKIDKSILWQAMKEKNAMTVLTSTMKMIKEIGKKIVVEGVETGEMAEILKENGCDFMQGYLYSRPIPEKDYIEFLKENN